MTLPLGSSDGLYYVQVQRAVQSEVLKTAQGNATIKHGDVRLDVELDLSNMAEPGIIAFGNTGSLKKRRYLTLRIPESILLRVHRRFRKAS